MRSAPRISWFALSAALIVFLISVLLSVVGPLLPRFAATGSPLAASLVMAGHPLGSLLAAVPTVFAARRWGQPKVIVAGSLLMCAATALFLLPDGAWAAFAARIGQGATGTVVWQSIFSWAFTASGPSHRGRTLGLLLTASTIGGLVGPQLGAAAATHGFWLFLPPAVLMAASSCYFLTLPPFPLSESVPVSSLRKAFRSRVGFAGVALGVIFPIASIALTTKLPLLLAAGGMGVFGIGAVLTANSAIGALTMPVFGRLIDHGHKRRLVFASALVASGAVSCLILAASLPQMIALALLSLAALGGLSLPSSLLISRAMDKAGLDQLVAQAICSVVWAPNAIAGSMIVGAIGSVTLALSLVAGGVFSVALVLAGDRLYHRLRPRTATA